MSILSVFIFIIVLLLESGCTYSTQQYQIRTSESSSSAASHASRTSPHVSIEIARDGSYQLVLAEPPWNSRAAADAEGDSSAADPESESSSAQRHRPSDSASAQSAARNVSSGRVEYCHHGLNGKDDCPSHRTTECRNWKTCSPSAHACSLQRNSDDFMLMFTPCWFRLDSEHVVWKYHHEVLRPPPVESLTILTEGPTSVRLEWAYPAWVNSNNKLIKDMPRETHLQELDLPPLELEFEIQVQQRLSNSQLKKREPKKWRWTPGTRETSPVIGPAALDGLEPERPVTVRVRTRINWSSEWSAWSTASAQMPDALPAVRPLVLAGAYELRPLLSIPNQSEATDINCYRVQLYWQLPTPFQQPPNGSHVEQFNFFGSNFNKSPLTSSAPGHVNTTTAGYHIIGTEVRVLATSPISQNVSAPASTLVLPRVCFPAAVSSGGSGSGGPSALRVELRALSGSGVNPALEPAVMWLKLQQPSNCSSRREPEASRIEAEGQLLVEQVALLDAERAVRFEARVQIHLRNRPCENECCEDTRTAVKINVTRDTATSWYLIACKEADCSFHAAIAAQTSHTDSRREHIAFDISASRNLLGPTIGSSQTNISFGLVWSVNSSHTSALRADPSDIVWITCWHTVRQANAACNRYSTAISAGDQLANSLREPRQGPSSSWFRHSVLIPWPALVPNRATGCRPAAGPLVDEYLIVVHDPIDSKDSVSMTDCVPVEEPVRLLPHIAQRAPGTPIVRLVDAWAPDTEGHREATSDNGKGRLELSVEVAGGLLGTRDYIVDMYFMPLLFEYRNSAIVGSNDTRVAGGAAGSASAATGTLHVRRQRFVVRVSGLSPTTALLIALVSPTVVFLVAVACVCVLRRLGKKSLRRFRPVPPRPEPVTDPSSSHNDISDYYPVVTQHDSGMADGVHLQPRWPPELEPLPEGREPAIEMTSVDT